MSDGVGNTGYLGSRMRATVSGDDRLTGLAPICHSESDVDR